MAIPVLTFPSMYLSLIGPQMVSVWIFDKKSANLTQESLELLKKEVRAAQPFRLSAIALHRAPEC